MQRVETSRMSPVNKGQSSFTLVELLVVIAIIGILVAITLQAAAGVMANAARSRAKGEIQAMATALESYKTDNGAYPQTGGLLTNSAAAPYNSASGGVDGSTTAYQTNSAYVYEALSSKINFADTTLSTNSPATGKAYFSFKVGQLGNTTSTGTVSTASTYIADPWGYSYGYSTGATNSYPYNGNGFYDLWSTAGLLAGSATNSAAWICNWQ